MLKFVGIVERKDTITIDGYSNKKPSKRLLMNWQKKLQSMMKLKL